MIFQIHLKGMTGGGGRVGAHSECARLLRVGNLVLLRINILFSIPGLMPKTLQ